MVTVIQVQFQCGLSLAEFFERYGIKENAWPCLPWAPIAKAKSGLPLAPNITGKECSANIAGTVAGYDQVQNRRPVARDHPVRHTHLARGWRSDMRRGFDSHQSQVAIMQPHPIMLR